MYNTYLTGAKSDPSLPPDWRFHTAKMLVKEKTKVRRNRDAALATLVRFLRKLDKAKTKYGVERVKQYFPFESQALQLYNKDNGIKGELEARILAREDYESIAKKLGTKAHTIDFYEKAFFNVTNRLDIPGYIINVVIEPEFRKNPTFGLWKLVGYKHGPSAVDWIIYRTLPQHKAGFASNDLAQDIYEEFLAKLFLAVKTLDVTKASSSKIIRIWGSIAEALNELAAGKGTSDSIQILQDFDSIFRQRSNTPEASGTNGNNGNSPKFPNGFRR